MTEKEILELEKDNYTTIHLHLVGIFWRAYGRSALGFCKEIRPYKMRRCQPSGPSQREKWLFRLPTGCDNKQPVNNVSGFPRDVLIETTICVRCQQLLECYGEQCEQRLERELQQW